MVVKITYSYLMITKKEPDFIQIPFPYCIGAY